MGMHVRLWPPVEHYRGAAAMMDFSDPRDCALYAAAVVADACVAMLLVLGFMWLGGVR